MHGGKFSLILYLRSLCVADSTFVL